MDVVERAKGMMLRTDREWSDVEFESGDPSYLFTSYVAILALIPAIAEFIGQSLVGVMLPDGGVRRLPVFAGLFNAILGYLMSFVVVYVVALIIDALAPRFGTRGNFPAALKLSVYSYTPAWLAGVFLVVPSLRFLTILGLWGGYLLLLGLPKLMRSPREQSLAYAAAVTASALAIALVIVLLQRGMSALPR